MAVATAMLDFKLGLVRPKDPYELFCFLLFEDPLVLAKLSPSLGMVDATDPERFCGICI